MVANSEEKIEFKDSPYFQTGTKGAETFRT